VRELDKKAVSKKVVGFSKDINADDDEDIDDDGLFVNPLLIKNTASSK
jgi:hypothetical protein